MANALSGGSPGSIMPPAPNPQPQAPQGAPGAPPAAPPPPPSHQQTVTALRHFHAIERELTGLLADPDVGKSDLKSKIIDGATKLVARGITTPGDAVAQLGTVPERPFDQRVWLEKHLAQTVQASMAILAHHAQGAPGGDTAPPSPDDHGLIISGLAQKYSGATNG